MDRIEQVLVTMRRQMDNLGEAVSAQSAINKAIRAELEGLGITLITHGDALEETVSRLEAIQAKLDEHDAILARPPVWETNELGPDPSVFAASMGIALNDVPTAPAPAKKSEAQIEAEKLAKANAKTEKALGARGQS